MYFPSKKMIANYKEKRFYKDPDDKFEKMKDIAEKELKHCLGHDMNHVMRVYNTAMKIAEGENIDFEVLKAALLLHDIGGEKEMQDSTGNTDHAVESAKMARPILQELGFSEEKINHICNCILSHRYRTEKIPETKEAKILYDANRLEVLGAIGIARSFIWTGKNKANLYRKIPVEEYARENLVGGKINGRMIDKTKHSPQLAFETKDKHVINRLFTEKAKEIARNRLEFSKAFFERLEKEINGEL
jgi:uncharacterized protein